MVIDSCVPFVVYILLQFTNIFNQILLHGFYISGTCIGFSDGTKIVEKFVVAHSKNLTSDFGIEVRNNSSINCKIEEPTKLFPVLIHNFDPFSALFRAYSGTCGDT